MFWRSHDKKPLRAFARILARVQVPHIAKASAGRSVTEIFLKCDRFMNYLLRNYYYTVRPAAPRPGLGRKGRDGTDRLEIRQGNGGEDYWVRLAAPRPGPQEEKARLYRPVRGSTG